MLIIWACTAILNAVWKESLISSFIFIMEYTALRHKKEFEIEKTRQMVSKFVICDNYRAFERIIKLYLMINETVLTFLG